MRLANVQIIGLYGRFDYQIGLNLDEDITILTAPNGYGKTAVISIIHNLLNGKLERIAKYPFSSATFMFDDLSVINVSVIGQSTFDFVDEKSKLFQIETVINHEEPERWQLDVAEFIRKSTLPIERYIPGIHRSGTHYYDTSNDEMLNHYELIERYGDQLPQSMRGEVIERPKFNSIIETIECHLIETQRLLKAAFNDRRRPQSPNTPKSAVAENAKDLAQKIDSATKSYAIAAQRLDQTFPERVLRQLPSDTPPDENELREKLSKLEARRGELSRFDLVEKTETNILGYQPSLKDNAVRNILSLYVQDSEKKLSSFDDLFSKIDLFSSICNAHFTFKTLHINAEVGMLIKDDEGRDIPLTSLSSGEQHILVLIYDLLFRVSRNALILVDEPELSLHVAWQKRFIADLQQIQTIQPMSIMVATHSPQIINDRWDLEIPLEAQA